MAVAGERGIVAGVELRVGRLALWLALATLAVCAMVVDVARGEANDTARTFTNAAVVNVSVPSFGTVTARTAPMPNATIAAGVLYAGRELSPQQVGPRSLEFHATGLVVRVTVARGAGPAVIRAASVLGRRVSVRVVVRG